MTDSQEQQQPEDMLPMNSEDSSASAESDSTPEEDLSIEEQLAACRNESHERYEQMLRARAELDNFRKRAQREQQEIRQYQSMSLIRDVLPTLDNLGRALEAAGESEAVEGLVQGVQMVRQQLDDTFKRHSVIPIEAVGQPFDPNLHEAVQQVPSADHPAMTVLQEIERGYTLHDRVVRPSKVIVSSGPPQGAEG